jgi:integrase
MSEAALRSAPLPDEGPDWMAAPVSSQSRFGDDLWLLDIQTAGWRRDQSRIDWNIPLPAKALIAPAEHTALIRTAKRFLWTMATDPPSGRKRSSPKTLQTRASVLRILLLWMAVEGISRFAEIDRRAVGRFTGWLRDRPGKRGGRGRLAPHTLVNYLIVLKDLYRQRAKLDDAPLVDPLPLETTYEAAGVTRDTKGAIPFIPDAIAIDLLSKALSWVEAHGDTIVAAEALRRETRAAAIATGRRRGASDDVRHALRQAALADPVGTPLDGAYAVRAAAAHLVEACFIVIAGFVGMRVSEILSMKVGAVERRPIGETGIEQAYVAARLFKTVDDPAGRLERWVAPAPVVRAVELLERLSEPLRKTSGRDDLFLVKNTQQGEIVPVTQMHISFRINAFADYIGLPLHEGGRWQLSTHQFRKTFARFIARRDRSQLLGLAEHFKHASVAMTAKGYVGSDFDLHQLVDHESRSETAAALDRLLTSDRLAGRMGERIAAGNARFRGRAGEQVRRDYIGFVLKETDLRIHACDYGWCVFQPETARCGGEEAPKEAGRSPAVCLSCVNMVVEERHAPYWRDRRARNLELLPGAPPLTQAVLMEAIEECDGVLNRLGGQDGGDG